jgi:hypothetical protein
MSLTAIVRLVLVPLVVAVVAGVELSPAGTPTAVAVAYLAFVVAQAAVILQGRSRLRLAQRRLAAVRRRRNRVRSSI